MADLNWVEDAWLGWVDTPVLLTRLVCGLRGIMADAADQDDLKIRRPGV